MHAKSIPKLILSNKGKDIKTVCIFSDLICKPIDMVEFSKHCKHNTTLKRAFPGATASQLKHFLKPTLIDNSPNIAIINVGTNNITKKRYQTEQEIFMEIMDVVIECQLGGVCEIYVLAHVGQAMIRR